MTHCCVTAGKMLLLQTVLRWWKTRMQEWWISAWLHTENASKPTARLCPDLNLVTVLLILHEDEMKTQRSPTALLSMWGMGQCELHHRTLGIPSGLCFKSHQGNHSVGISNSIWLHLKKPNKNNPTQNCMKIKKHYLWPILLQKTASQPIRNPLLTPSYLKLHTDICRWQQACTLKSHFLLFLCLQVIAKEGTLLTWFFAAVLFLFRYK